MGKNFLVLFVLFVMFSTAFVAGCTTNISPTVTPSSTPTPTPDYSKAFNKQFTHNETNDVWTVAQNFTKSKNERGNDVYFGVIRNESYKPKYELTVTIEIAKSNDEAKQLYSQAVINKANDGYIPYTAMRNHYPEAMPMQNNYPEGDSWYGNKGPLMALINYYQSATVDGQWVVSIQTGGWYQYKQEEYSSLSDFIRIF